MENDPKVLVMGEDVGKLGGVFRVTDGLQKDFGEDRVIDTPLAECGIIGTAIGLALRGYRPVCEIQFDGFVYPAYDQIVSQLAKMREPLAWARSSCRSSSGSRSAAASARSSTTARARRRTSRTPPACGSSRCANPADAYWMIQQAIASDDPVIFFEPKRRYWEKGELDVAAGPRAAALHEARVVRPGEHVTRRGLRPDGQDRAWRPPPPPTDDGTQHRGRRPALALAARPRHPRRVGREDPPARRRARGAGVPRPRRGDRRPGHRAVLLPPGGAGAAGRRVPHAVPGRAGSRRSTCPTWTGCSTPSTASLAY